MRKNDKKIYKIEVMMYVPTNELGSSKPFFWCLMSNTGDKWYNEGFGWESSIEKAWEAAYNFYKKLWNVAQKCGTVAKKTDK